MTTKEPTVPTDRSFARQLDALKRRGCNLLVSSDVESEGAFCRHSLGHSEEPRRHLFVPTTTTVHTVLSRHDRARDPATLAIVDATGASATRGTATTQRPGDVDPAAEWYERVESLDPGEIGPTAMAHLDRLGNPAPEPGELRLCVESLDPFLELVPETSLFELLHVLTARIRELHGIGHYHVAGEATMEPLEPYRPLFDATVRVRVSEKGRRERWTLHETDHDSGWIDRESEQF